MGVVTKERVFKRVEELLEESESTYSGEDQ